MHLLSFYPAETVMEALNETIRLHTRYLQEI